MEQSDIETSHLAHFVVLALVDLVHCLKNRGALGERQYEAALRSTIEKAGAAAQQLNYSYLAVLLQALEKQQPHGAPPDVDPIH
jgi:hypothetical protein